MSRPRSGLTLAEYEALLAKQDGRCLLCGKMPRRIKLAVDHDHVTQRIRGLLCSRCNRALGAFEWGTDVLARLMGYCRLIIIDREATRIEEEKSK